MDKRIEKTKTALHAAGLLDDEPETEPTKAKDYSVLGDYHVSNY